MYVRGPIENAKTIVLFNRIHTIYQILTASHFVVLYIGCRDGVEQLLRTVNFGSLNGG